MSGRTSQAMSVVMEKIRTGTIPAAAARQVGVALSTLYRSGLYKTWKNNKNTTPTGE